MEPNLHNLELFIASRQLRVVCVRFVIHNAFYESLLNSFFGPKTELLIHSYTHTGTLNKTHSQKTKSPYCHPAVQMYNVFVFGKPQALLGPLWSCLLTESFIQILSCDPLSDPIPDYPAPAAGAAEWLYYISYVLNERGNGKTVICSLSLKPIREKHTRLLTIEHSILRRNKLWTQHCHKIQVLMGNFLSNSYHSFLVIFVSTSTSSIFTKCFIVVLI